MSMRWKKKKSRKNEFSRQTFFCVRVNDVYRYKNDIHVTLKKLNIKYNLKWLHTSMSYHKFSNTSEILEGDLTSNLIKDIGSKDFNELGCNC